ncbi:adhesion G protein-coupled receptor E1-like [Latimeria chalumnae]|uniref:adhesion G protein-coupled receptor E1-like n=1 Tax=Latimeria chalumnae TaxID=7897 RepID=UPI00313F330C
MPIQTPPPDPKMKSHHRQTTESHHGEAGEIRKRRRRTQQSRRHSTPRRGDLQTESRAGKQRRAEEKKQRDAAMKITAAKGKLQTPTRRKDINECEEVSTLCNPSGTCINLNGRYMCKCNVGYTRSSADLDKQCIGTAQKVYRICQTERGKESGILWERGDIDECSLNSTICGKNASCTNTEGSYNCTCDPGYTRFANKTQCEDDDECSNPQTCPPYSSCINTEGSYICKCNPGYRKLNADLQNVECAGPHSCDGDVHLHRLDVKCSLQIYLDRTKNIRRLDQILVSYDINECEEDSTLCNPSGTCINLNGRYMCKCNLGYARNSADLKKKCIDIDECSLNSRICGKNASCTNTEGSYKCTCDPGYTRFANKTQCEDIDECKEIPSPCGLNAKCTNAEGSYKCFCQEGYFPSTGKTWETNVTQCTENQTNVSQPNDYVKKCNKSSFNQTVGCLESYVQNVSVTSNWSKEERFSVASFFIQTMEQLALSLANISSGQKRKTVTTQVYEMEIRDLRDNCTVRNKTVQLLIKGNAMDISCETVIRGKTSAVAFISYTNMESILDGRFFQDSNSKSGQMNSKVVTATTSNTELHQLNEPVHFTFHRKKVNGHNEREFCVYWKQTTNEGTWSSEGCSLLSSNQTHTICSSDHLSSFAVIIAAIEIERDIALEVITYVGIILSLVCLAACIVTLKCFNSVRTTSTTIHLHLCVCLFLAELLFLIGMDRTSNKTLCGIIAGFLHYLFLACFAWMLLEGFQLYLMVRNLKVVNYFSTHSIKRRFMYPIGYGLPAVIVVISAAVFHIGYGTKNHCWLTTEKGFVWSFLGPVCTIIGINSILFVVILWILRRNLSTLNTDVATLKNNRSITLKAIAQCVILGCTWIVGIFHVQKETLVLAYLFTIFNSLQGTAIFTIHCVLNRQVREEYRKYFRRCLKRKARSSEASSSTFPLTVVSAGKTMLESEK